MEGEDNPGICYITPMKLSSLIFILWLFLGLSYSCNEAGSVIEDEAAYTETLEQWQQDRVERVKGKEGWLNLAGIYWLKEGEQSFGSHPSNDHVFPEKAPAFIGALIRKGDSVHIRMPEDVEAYYQGQRATELHLSYDRSGVPDYITHGDFAWYIMKRHTSLAIRLRDYKHPAIEAMDSIPCYSIDPEYVVEAKLIPFEEEKTITVATPFQDYTQDYQCPGELHFKLKGKKLKLLPFISGDQYFIILSDETSGIDTYGGGRFMYVSPHSGDRIILDFNKAYNPPCALTPFAACPMPPPENHLPITIEAGEKTIRDH
jgi:uncharacterized protein (DUF1684 family)